jgi:hypothetical protein
MSALVAYLAPVASALFGHHLMVFTSILCVTLSDMLGSRGLLGAAVPLVMALRRVGCAVVGLGVLRVAAKLVTVRCDGCTTGIIVVPVLADGMFHRIMTHISKLIDLPRDVDVRSTLSYMRVQSAPERLTQGRNVDPHTHVPFYFKILPNGKAK